MCTTQDFEQTPCHATSNSGWPRSGPTVVLLLLSPVIAELLYGSVRVSKIWGLLPQIMTWGYAALLIRECVRRLGKGWPSMLLFGLALAIAVEWVILQTSIAPLVGPGERGYGRAWE